MTLGLMSVPLVAAVLYFVLVYFRPPMPGDQPSPKLVEMFNREIDEQLARIGGPPFLGSLEPPYRPDAADSARRWLSEVREVVTHCGHGGRGGAHNPQAYDLTLQSGAVLSDVTASLGGCIPGFDTPMRVTFEAGRVVQVTTDGSERESTPEVARTRVKAYVEALVRHDARLHPERYYLGPAKPSDPAQAWDAS